MVSVSYLSRYLAMISGSSSLLTLPKTSFADHEDGSQPAAAEATNLVDAEEAVVRHFLAFYIEDSPGLVDEILGSLEIARGAEAYGESVLAGLRRLEVMVESNYAIYLREREAYRARKLFRSFSRDIGEFFLNAVEHHDEASRLGLPLVDKGGELLGELNLSQFHYQPP